MPLHGPTPQAIASHADKPYYIAETSCRGFAERRENHGGDSDCGGATVAARVVADHQGVVSGHAAHIEGGCEDGGVRFLASVLKGLDVAIDERVEVGSGELCAEIK